MQIVVSPQIYFKKLTFIRTVALGIQRPIITAKYKIEKQYPIIKSKVHVKFYEWPDYNAGIVVKLKKCVFEGTSKLTLKIYHNNGNIFLAFLKINKTQSLETTN